MKKCYFPLSLSQNTIHSNVILQTFGALEKNIYIYICIYFERLSRQSRGINFDRYIITNFRLSFFTRGGRRGEEWRVGMTKVARGSRLNVSKIVQFAQAVSETRYSIVKVIILERRSVVDTGLPTEKMIHGCISR